MFIAFELWALQTMAVAKGTTLGGDLGDALKFPCSGARKHGANVKLAWKDSCLA